VDTHIPEGHLRRQGFVFPGPFVSLRDICVDRGLYSPGRSQISLEHSGQGSAVVICQKVEKEALSANQDFFGKNILAQSTSPEFLTEHAEPQRELPLDW
jgi:hypothetical protein